MAGSEGAGQGRRMKLDRKTTRSVNEAVLAVSERGWPGASVCRVSIVTCAAKVQQQEKAR